MSQNELASILSTLATTLSQLQTHLAAAPAPTAPGAAPKAVGHTVEVLARLTALEQAIHTSDERFQKMVEEAARKAVQAAVEDAMADLDISNMVDEAISNQAWRHWTDVIEQVKGELDVEEQVKSVLRDVTVSLDV